MITVHRTRIYTLFDKASLHFQTSSSEENHQLSFKNSRAIQKHEYLIIARDFDPSFFDLFLALHKIGRVGLSEGPFIAAPKIA